PRRSSDLVLHVMFHTRRLCEFLELQRQRIWEYRCEPAMHEVRVGLMELGVMGEATAKALKPLAFHLRGWSRSQKSIEGVECYAGQENLDAFLAGTDILACTLPITPETRGIINRDLLRKLSQQGRHPQLPGPVLINAGRGWLQVEADILTALDAGELFAASLDVFEN